jgi:hypothetical protein
VYGCVDRAGQQGTLDFLGKNALATYFGQGPVPDLVAGGLNLDDFHVTRSRKRTQKASHMVRLP